MSEDAIAASWQLVALSGDLGRKRPIQRRLAGTPIALYRTEAGVHGLIDRCPHRNYPLSEGRIVGGTLECAYHGWRFGADGACVAVPGCSLDAGEGKRLGARPVQVMERAGGIFVWLADGAPEPFEAPTVFGDPDHDHFWWAQGVWKGRAFDAIENVLDPFHTNFIHHGFIRRRDRRMSVTLGVNQFERGIEMVIEQDRPDLGIMSRALERGRARSRTRYYPPAMVQARWEGEARLTLCVTAFFTPVDKDHFRPFACFTTPKGLAPAWLKQIAIRSFLAPVVAQDRRALARQHGVVTEFGAPRYAQGPGDLLGERVHRLWSGQRLEPRSDAPVRVEL